jgi:hypothetical protein
LARIEAPQVGGRLDEVKERGFGGLRQGTTPPTIEALT